MKRRILRALQRGGLTAKRQGDEWAVWRSYDRRRRIIGTLSGAEVDVLRLNDCLVSDPAASPKGLIWNVTHSGVAFQNMHQKWGTFSDVPLAKMRALDGLVSIWSDPIVRGQVVDLVLSLRHAPEQWVTLEAVISNSDRDFLQRLLTWPSTKRAFAASEGLRVKALEVRATSIFRRALRRKG